MVELKLNTTDIIRLADILKTKEAVLHNRYLHYKDIHEGGEATEKQQQLLYDAEEDYTLVKYIIGVADIMRKQIPR